MYLDDKWLQHMNEEESEIQTKLPGCVLHVNDWLELDGED